MKTLKLSLFALAATLFLSVSANAQETNKKSTAVKATTTTTATTVAPVAKPTGLTFKDDTYSFGDIPKGTPATHEFTFKNTSKQTILITNVKASCGCTTPTYTKTPIKPGENGVVAATYNAANPGSFNKTITVTTNDTETPKILTIKGKVEAPAAEATPAGTTTQQ